MVFILNVSPTTKKIDAISQCQLKKILQETSWNHQNKEENKNINNGENDIIGRDDLKN